MGNTQNVKCPHCGSKETRKQFSMSIASMLGFLLIGFLFPVSKKTFHCFDCGKNFTWKKVKDK
jgi:DNA-directed RNA polymerase subunit RPC12/RpoP